MNCTSVNTSYNFDFYTPTCFFASPTCCILPSRLQVVWGWYFVYLVCVVKCLSRTQFKLLGSSAKIKIKGVMNIRDKQRQ